MNKFQAIAAICIMGFTASASAQNQWYKAESGASSSTYGNTSYHSDGSSSSTYGNTLWIQDLRLEHNFYDDDGHVISPQKLLPVSMQSIPVLEKQLGKFSFIKKQLIGVLLEHGMPQKQLQRQKQQLQIQTILNLLKFGFQNSTTTVQL